jgi:hypothetical protein
MILFDKHTWATALAVLLTLLAECSLAAIFLILYFVIYTMTGYEPLNTGLPVLIGKGILILVPGIYNAKKVIAGYKSNDSLTVSVFVGITIIYSLGILFLGGGGR